MTKQEMYAELYRALVDQREMSRRRVAQQCGLHHSTVIRILDQAAETGIDTMDGIGRAIGAVPMRAIIAVEILEDPSAYFSPVVRVVAELLGSLLNELQGLDDHLFEGFINHEFAAITSMLVKTMKAALEARDRRLSFR